MKLYVLLALLGGASALRVEGDDNTVPEDGTESMADPLDSMIIPAEDEPEPSDEPNSLAALTIEGIDDDQESIAHPISLAATTAPGCVDQTATEIKQTELPYNATEQQKEMLLWHNYARTDPVGKLVPELEKMLTRFGTGSKANFYYVPGQITLMTNEGRKAVQDAIDWIKAKDRRVPAINWDQVLAQASKDMAVAQGKTSQTGHTGPDGSKMSQRIAKYGRYQVSSGENIAYGTVSGKENIIQLFVDDGVASRGHRTNIMNDKFKILGAWQSTHKGYDHETVLNYAGGMVSNGKFKPLKNYDCATGKGITSTSASTSSGSSTTPAAKSPAAKTPIPTNNIPSPYTPASSGNEATDIAKFTNDILEECDANKDAYLSKRELYRCVWQMYRKQAKEVRAQIKESRTKMQAERKDMWAETRAENKKRSSDMRTESKKLMTDYRTKAKEEWNNLKDDKGHYKDLSKTLWDGAKKQPSSSSKGINHESITDYLTKAGGWKEVQKFHKEIE